MANLRELRKKIADKNFSMDVENIKEELIEACKKGDIGYFRSLFSDLSEQERAGILFYGISKELRETPKNLAHNYGQKLLVEYLSQVMSETSHIFIYTDGTKNYFKNGLLHREDGPAIEYSNGTKEWYINDERHREDGPAIEWSNGNKEWYQNGKLHREDGPAIEFTDGSKKWYQNDALHREGGPAIEYPDGEKHWYLNGGRYTEEEYNRKTGRSINTANLRELRKKIAKSKKDNKHNEEKHHKESTEIDTEAKKGRCWEGHEPTPGKKPYSPGSCRKKKASINLGLLKKKAEMNDSDYDLELLEEKCYNAGDINECIPYLREYHEKYGNTRFFMHLLENIARKEEVQLKDLIQEVVK